MKIPKEGNKTSLEAESWIEAALQSKYSKVVWAGKRRPYEFSNLFRAPKNFFYQDYQNEFRVDLLKLLREGKLGPFRCAKLALSYYFLIILFYGAISIINTILPLSLKMFMSWYEEKNENDNLSGLFHKGKSFRRGLAMVALFGFLMIVRALLQAWGCEAKTKMGLVFYNMFGVTPSPCLQQISVFLS